MIAFHVCLVSKSDGHHYHDFAGAFAYWTARAEVAAIEHDHRRAIVDLAGPDGYLRIEPVPPLRVVVADDLGDWAGEIRGEDDGQPVVFCTDTCGNQLRFVGQKVICTSSQIRAVR